MQSHTLVERVPTYRHMKEKTGNQNVKHVSNCKLLFTVEEEQSLYTSRLEKNLSGVNE